MTQIDGVRQIAHARRNKRPATRWQPALFTRHFANLTFGTLDTKAVLHMPIMQRNRAETAVNILNGKGKLKNAQIQLINRCVPLWVVYHTVSAPIKASTLNPESSVNGHIPLVLVERVQSHLPPVWKQNCCKESSH